MTEPSITEQAEDLRVQLQAVVDAQPAYGARPSMPLAAGVALTRMVRDLARGERSPEGAVDILLEHQGPHFNGHTSRCQCGEQVRSGRDWAEHVNQALGGAR